VRAAARGREAPRGGGAPCASRAGTLRLVEEYLSVVLPQRTCTVAFGARGRMCFSYVQGRQRVLSNCVSGRRAVPRPPELWSQAAAAAGAPSKLQLGGQGDGGGTCCW